MRHWKILAAFAAVALLLSACSSGDGDGSKASRAATSTTTSAPLARPYGVGRVTETLVDSTRPTPAGVGRPELPQRTIDTSIYYPAAGNPEGDQRENAPPTTDGGPFPLVVLAHGLGGNEEYLAPLAQQWVAAGYVVAMPHFPLTYGGTTGGVDGADVQNQPGDVSFVIDEVLKMNAGTSTPLAGLVNPKQIGAAGHSNGAITTLGVVANSCCRDERIRTALVLAGTPSPFAGGTYDLSKVPPILFVHGVNDQLLSYNQAVETFNGASTPKAMLTLAEAGHADWLAPTNAAFPVAARATTDFLDAYLRGDSSAVDRIAADQSPPLATMAFAPDAASAVTVPTVPVPETNRKASVSADTGLTNGQVVTVTWSGFLPGKTVNVLQCVGDGRGGTSTCGIAEGHVLVADPTGAGSIDLTVHTGPFANGVCDAQRPCTILVNDSGLLDKDAFVYFPITFAS
ncbi:MAG TPA: neocarzinostatin apoprotein domain-containing protein [Microthrixaceae bacterium]|nr:neocarzinostatin apoprotein domain-containing protein [Microthrixaceae bacterium]